MKWIWEHQDWPHFIYDESRFAKYEIEFHRNAGLIIGSLSGISNSEIDDLRVTILSDEALDTSRIEGEILDRDSVQSSIRKNLGLQTDGRRAKPGEAGISQMLVDLYKTYNDALTHDKLFAWHAMITNGRTDLEVVGGFRRHVDPMQIVSGRLDGPKVFYEAPPSDRLTEEMDAFVKWYNRAAEEGMLTIIHAGIAHLYFELIHPFEDGNGRVGRAIAEKSLSMATKLPLVTSLSRVIELDKKAYYHALEKANNSLDINEWLEYFAKKVLDAQIHVRDLISFVISKAKFIQEFDPKLNERQKKIIMRLFKAGLDGFEGGLSAENYIRITQTSRATATRDLQELVEIGALKREGKLRHTRYYLRFESRNSKIQ